MKFMRRAIQLAKSSLADTHPNPNVGAIIVANGRIIGEGYHRRCGSAHAEVNAVNSVADADRPLLKESTIYVTLEPCSHYGKTPPCAKLIIDTGIPRVVIACGDPFEKVRGRGVAMLRDAGVEVVEGVLEEEARELNPKFFRAHTLRRPFITLKWAQSADGYMDAARFPGEPHFQFSTPLDSTLVHRERALHDALLTTAATLLADNPRLDVRLWDGPDPAVVVIDRKGLINKETAASLKLFQDRSRRIILVTSSPLPGANIKKPKAAAGTTCSCTNVDNIGAVAGAPLAFSNVENIEVAADAPLDEIMRLLYDRGITSIITEAGPRLLQALIDAGLYDATRIFTSPHKLGSRGSAPAPKIK